LVYPLEKDYHTEKIGDLRVVHTTQRARYKYTRSRDVLKTIRPEKWIPKLSRSGRFDRVGEDYRFREWGEFDFVLHGEENEDWKQVVASAKTEELAELHAIIQAIEWERTYKP